MVSVYAWLLEKNTIVTFVVWQAALLLVPNAPIGLAYLGAVGEMQVHLERILIYLAKIFGFTFRVFALVPVAGLAILCFVFGFVVPTGRSLYATLFGHKTHAG